MKSKNVVLFLSKDVIYCNFFFHVGKITEFLENNEGEYSDVIKIGNNYLIIKVDQIRIDQIEINKDKELEKLIQTETNKQLNQFSRIYFMKSKINYTINEQ